MVSNQQGIVGNPRATMKSVFFVERSEYNFNRAYRS